MSVEQVARDFVSHMEDAEKWQSMVTEDAMASGGILPQPIPIGEAMKVMDAFTTAFPGVKFDIQQVSVNGNQATVNVVLNGTNTGTLSLPMPEMQPIPPTGKTLSVKDTFIVTVEGDKVSHLQVESPPDGGIPSMLAQMGVRMPSM